MPGTRSGARGRGPRLAKLAGVAIAVAIVGAGAAGYRTLSAQRPAPSSATPLPRRVVSEQTVGLAAVSASQPGQLLQLLGTPGALAFTPVPPASLQAGTGQWTANLMAGNAYIFIFVPDGRCLTETGTPGRQALTLQHCNLQASQRWRRAGPAHAALGHNFYQYASLADGACLADTGALAGSGQSAGLAPCAAADPAQRIAFWWQSQSA